jgi:phosphatidate cytidylyltransferase
MIAIGGASIILVAGAVTGLVAAGAWALLRRVRPRGGLTGRTALERAVSYAVLALVLALAASLGSPGIAILIGAIGAIALVEWSNLMDLPIHHRAGLQVANVAIVGSVAVLGSDAAGWLVGGLVLVGLAWPVLRADTDRALRDLGSAAVGCIMIPGLLVHGVALAVERGQLGVTLFVALAVACAGSDVGAFIVGRRFGRTPLAPILSPTKTREGVVGNVVGAGVGLAPFAALLAPDFEPQALLVIVVLVAVGSLWGDLFESAVKREAGVKDAARWLPGFGGILDRIDSLLLVVPLVYWAMRVADVAR